METRAATPKYRVMETGDELVFVCGGKKLKKFVRAVHIFKTTKGLIKKYKIKDINPAFKTEKEMKEMWLGFPGYAEKIKKYGLIAAELK